MADTIIKMKKGIKPKKPILLVGLPGIGNVGRIVAEHLIKELKARPFAVIYSKHFPHQVVMLKNGTVRMVSNRFYLLPGKKGASDIIILTGDVQAVSPEGQFAVNKRIVHFFRKRLGGTFIYTLGGYHREDVAPTTAPKVFGNATNRQVVESLKSKGVVFGESQGMIWGSAGQIIAFAKMERMDGVCLMGESTFMDLDATAAKAVVKVVAKLLNLSVDTKNLDTMIENTTKAMRELESQMANAVGAVPGGPQLPQSPKQPSYIR